MTARNMVSTTVYLTREQDYLLKLLARKLQAPMADLVRDGVDMVIDKYRAHLLVQRTEPAAAPSAAEHLDSEPLPSGMLAVSADAEAHVNLDSRAS